MKISDKIEYYNSEIDELLSEWETRFTLKKQILASDSSDDELTKLRICMEQILLMKKLKNQLNQYANRFAKWED